MTDHIHQVDLCPDCDGLRVTELTSLGTKADALACKAIMKTSSLPKERRP
ncbi:hypothetical protein [Streptomyces scabiei]|nr:hypothetical protein [Streptomyces scabiei]